MLSTICCWEFYMFLFWYTFLIVNRFNHTVVKTHCYFTLAWLFWVSQLDWLFNIYVNNCNFDQSQIVFFWVHITTFCIIDILISPCFKVFQLHLCRIDHYNYLYIHSFIISVTCLSSIACNISVQNYTTIVRSNIQQQVKLQHGTYWYILV